MLIVKLGGSVITAKGRYRTYMSKATERIIVELSRIKEKKVIVHGGGSFGHILAKKYGLPGKVSKERLRGFSEIHSDMVDLNNRICRMINHEIGPCISIPPANFLNGLERDARWAVDNDLIPVLFGDVYIEKDLIGIISGDMIMQRLAVELRPETAVFLTDVDGIYTSNPREHKGSKLLRVLEGNVSTSLSRDDVTGGMQGKIEQMKKIAGLGTKVYVMNGRKPERLNDLERSSFLGTVIR
jgi:isopentenyl phosphate kinase